MVTLRTKTDLDVALKQNKIEGPQFDYLKDGSEPPNQEKILSQLNYPQTEGPMELGEQG